MKQRGRITRLAGLVVAAAVAIAAGGCAPDLTIDPAAAVPYTIDFTGAQATAHIANVGNEDAGEFLVYLEISDPATPAAGRPDSQATRTISSLAAGGTTTLNVPLADFSPRFGSGYDPTTISTGFLEVRVDAKGYVEEKDEANNYFSGTF